MKYKHLLIIPLLILLLAGEAIQAISPASKTAPALKPLSADTRPSKVPEKILRREGYLVSYNTTTRQPNYVAWTLNRNRLKGNVQRSKSFFEDPELADNEKAKLKDYYNSGYDRGHICPAGDNKWSKVAMLESFLLSNICPQTHTLNAGDWVTLEELCREWTQQTDLHIISGPMFLNASHRKLNKRVTVPSHFFKAIVTLTQGKEEGIAFIYQNNKEKHPIQYYVRSIDEVENLLRFNLFQELPASLQKRIEANKNWEKWLKHMPHPSSRK